VSSLLIVDGYNVIFRAERYQKAKAAGLEVAVERLVNDLVNLGAFQGLEIVVVFDGKQKSQKTVGPVKVIFTSEKQKADEVIARLVFNLKEPATVCTNDYLLQKLIFRPGIMRLTVAELMALIDEV
jgi:predicted RNA-binding protein with PIN domain